MAKYLVTFTLARNVQYQANASSPQAAEAAVRIALEQHGMTYAMLGEAVVIEL